jgi:hypothetical protein
MINDVFSLYAFSKIYVDKIYNMAPKECPEGSFLLCLQIIMRDSVLENLLVLFVTII